MFEAEAEDNSSRPSPKPRTKFWPRGQLVLEDLTSLLSSHFSLSSLDIRSACVKFVLVYSTSAPSTRVATCNDDSQFSKRVL